MALKKEIELDNGIITNYHRISSINTIINQRIQIIVYSYINNTKRIQEEEELNNDVEIVEIANTYNFISSQMLTKEYEENFDVVAAYEYLKTLDIFADAEDC